jgi:hypothetical protein
VLGIVRKQSLFSWWQKNTRNQKLVDDLAGLVGFPGPTLIIALENNNKPLRKVFERIQDRRFIARRFYKPNVP